MNSTNTRPPRLSDRMFGLSFVVVFSIIAVVGWLIFDRLIVWALSTAIVFALLALLAPGLLLPLNRLWEVFAHKLGTFNNSVLLGLFFFLFIVPIGTIFRLLGNDPMTRKLKKEAPTYWTPVSRQANPDTFADMF